MHRFILLLLVPLLGAPPASDAKRAKPVPCAPGTFVPSAADRATLSAALGIEAEGVVVTSGVIAIGSCTGRARTKAARTSTRVTGRLGACGSVRKVTVVATLAAPACDVAQVTVRGKKRKRLRFRASRAVETGTTTTTSTLPRSGGTTTSTTVVTTTLPGGSTTTTTLAPPPPLPPTSQQLIADALRDGRIDRPTSLRYRAYALFGDDRLPAEFDGIGTTGEDTLLFLEILRRWGELSTEVQAELLPFLARPTDPESLFYPKTEGALAGLAAAPTEPVAVECPFAPGAATPDWRPTETAHFVVWSCGRGDLSQDPDAARRVIVADMLEGLYATMVPALATPRPDELASGPAPTNRIDVYVVRPNECRFRDTGCEKIQGDTLAAAVPTKPCGRSGGGPLTSSGFLLVGATRVPDLPPPSPASIRYELAHELFHLLSYALNLEAQGGACPGTPPEQAGEDSWLAEASAEWAAWAFARFDGPVRRDALYYNFQRLRPSQVSLREATGEYPYQAFVYPFFVQQERASRDPILTLWKQSTQARTPEDLDDVLDGLFPFAEHFRDFAVRNLNDPSVLPLATRHQAQDPTMSPGTRPLPIAEPFTLPVGGPIPQPAHMAPLAAQYQEHIVGPGVRWVRLDFQELSNSGFLDVDILANVRGTWERRRVQGLRFEFCRDDAADDIGQYHVVLSNHDRKLPITGSWRVETRGACPAGLTGWIETVTTRDRYRREPSPPDGEHTEWQNRREVQRYTLLDTTPGTEPGDLGSVTVQWDAITSVSRGNLTTGQCIEGLIVGGSATGSGSGHATNHLGLFPTGVGDGIGIQPIDIVGRGTERETGVYFLCGGGTVDRPVSETAFYNLVPGVIAGIQDLATLKAAPNDPNASRGEVTLFDHTEPEPGGFDTVRQIVRWDIRKSRLR